MSGRIVFVNLKNILHENLRKNFCIPLTSISAIEEVQNSKTCIHLYTGDRLYVKDGYRQIQRGLNKIYRDHSLAFPMIDVEEGEPAQKPAQHEDTWPTWDPVKK